MFTGVYSIFLKFKNSKHKSETTCQTVVNKNINSSNYNYNREKEQKHEIVEKASMLLVFEGRLRGICNEGGCSRVWEPIEDKIWGHQRKKYQMNLYRQKYWDTWIWTRPIASIEAQP